jgi:hypothetical protein
VVVSMAVFSFECISNNAQVTDCGYGLR